MYANVQFQLNVAIESIEFECEFKRTANIVNIILKRNLKKPSTYDEHQANKKVAVSGKMNGMRMNLWCFFITFIFCKQSDKCIAHTATASKQQLHCSLLMMILWFYLFNGEKCAHLIRWRFFCLADCFTCQTKSFYFFLYLSLIKEIKMKKKKFIYTGLL